MPRIPERVLVARTATAIITLSIVRFPSFLPHRMGETSRRRQHPSRVRVLEGGSDEEILIYNSFMSKRGWRDDESDDFIPSLNREYGFPDDDRVVTDFDVIEVDEGRPVDAWRHAWDLP